MNRRHFAKPRYHLDIGLLIGALAGVAGIGFHFLADRFGALLFGWIEPNQAPSACYWSSSSPQLACAWLDSSSR
jgi:hypothetical protein